MSRNKPNDALQSIAQTVGVSSNTVLRVLRGQNKEVWPSAIRRAEEIRALAGKLGYLPNSSARAVRRGRFDTVALLLSSDCGHSYLPDALFNRIHDSLSQQHMRLVVSKLSDEELTSQKSVPAILRELSCDGLLINYTDHIPAKMLKLIRRHQIPSIWINTRQDADCVYYDDFSGAMAMTEQLLRLGHRNIAYLDFVPRTEQIHYSRIDRYEGYAQAMRSAGLAPQPHERFAGTAETNRLEATRALLKSADRPTALISYDAGERLLLAAALAGLRVPEDLSICSFGRDRSVGGVVRHGEEFIGRAVTTAMVPSGKAGQQAVAMLMKKIADSSARLQPSVISLELAPGDTCGPVPSSRMI